LHPENERQRLRRLTSSTDTISRHQAAKFLANAFKLTLYAP
jgi:hypothetical protein